MKIRPAVTILPYQQRWIDDPSQFVIANKARQLGYTWGTMFALVMDCIQRKTKWYYFTVNEERAKEAIDYGVIHAEAMESAASSQSIDTIFDGVKYKKLSIVFPNGSQIIGLPSNYRTVRGASGNIVFDEFAHHLDAGKVWTAASPVVTRGYKIRVLSTPNGKQGKFYEIWDGGKGWSRHETNIYQAVEQGLSVNIDLLRDMVGSDDDFEQEYNCQFLDEAHSWLPYSLIETAYHGDATLYLDSSIRPVGPMWLGVDVARKRDLTVLWLNEQIADVHWTRSVLTLCKTKFSTQRQAISDLMPMVRRCCIDANGVGAQLAEECTEAWTEQLVEGVSMNGQVPGMIATKVKKQFEDRKIRIPDDSEIRRDLHQVRRVHTEAGNVRFEAPRTKDGHADRFWALGLALHAAEPISTSVDYEGVETSRWLELSGNSGSLAGRNWSEY